MHRRSTTFLALVIVTALGAPAAARATDLSWSVLGGYQQGMGVRALGTLSRFSSSVPIGIQFGFGYTVMDPGDAAAARRVFINDNTDGTPEKSGHAWDLRADLVWMLGRIGFLDEVGVFCGPRYSMFTGRFRYEGGNEDFLVEANSWGVGFGARAELKLNPKWSIAGAIGVDWFPSISLYAHDTTYSSSGTVVNAHHAYGWGDADRAINEPKLMPSVMFGMAWRP